MRWVLRAQKQSSRSKQGRNKRNKRNKHGQSKLRQKWRKQGKQRKQRKQPIRRFFQFFLHQEAWKFRSNFARKRILHANYLREKKYTAFPIAWILVTEFDTEILIGDTRIPCTLTL